MTSVRLNMKCAMWILVMKIGIASTSNETTILEREKIVRNAVVIGVRGKRSNITSLWVQIFFKAALMRNTYVAVFCMPFAKKENLNKIIRSL